MTINEKVAKILYTTVQICGITLTKDMHSGMVKLIELGVAGVAG